MDVQLKPDLAEFVERQVAAGHFADAGQVIEAALQLLHDEFKEGPDPWPLDPEQERELERRLEAYRGDGNRGRPALEALDDLRNRLCK